MSVTNGFSVPLFLNHSNNAVQEMLLSNPRGCNRTCKLKISFCFLLFLFSHYQFPRARLFKARLS